MDLRNILLIIKYINVTNMHPVHFNSKMALKQQPIVPIYEQYLNSLA